MSTVCSELTETTAGRCADCGVTVARRTPYHDERQNVVRDVCIRCLVLAYQQRQFESGCCG